MNVFTCNGEEVTDLSNLTVKDEGCFYNSKTRLKKGKWYFEYQHLDGNHKEIIGYSSRTCQLHANPDGTDDLFVYITGSECKFYGIPNSNVNLTRYSLNLSDKYIGRIGIGIDIDNQYISFTYSNYSRIFHFESGINEEWKIVARESQLNSFVDRVSLHLNDFQYLPPFGANPWGKFPRMTIPNNHHFQVLPLFYLFILVFK